MGLFINFNIKISEERPNVKYKDSCLIRPASINNIMLADMTKYSFNPFEFIYVKKRTNPEIPLINAVVVN